MPAADVSPLQHPPAENLKPPMASDPARRAGGPGSPGQSEGSRQSDCVNAGNADEAEQALSEQARLDGTEELVERFHGDVYRYSYWLSGCANAAEDITQETFLRAYRSLHTLRNPAAAKNWLFTIARNECTRLNRKTPPVLSEDLDHLTDQWDPQKRFEANEWLQRGLAELQPEFRLVVLMYYFEQLSYAEIAEELNIPLGTVMSRLSRGRQHLRQQLEELESPNQHDSQAGHES